MSTMSSYYISQAAIDLGAMLDKVKGREVKEASSSEIYKAVICPLCGTENYGSKYCPNCGAALTEDATKYRHSDMSDMGNMIDRIVNDERFIETLTQKWVSTVLVSASFPIGQGLKKKSRGMID